MKLSHNSNFTSMLEMRGALCSGSSKIAQTLNALGLGRRELILYLCLCVFVVAELLSLVRYLPYFQFPRAKADIEEKMKEIIVEQLGVDKAKVTPKARFVEDLGADSMDMVELVMAFEAAAEIEILDKDGGAFHTVEDAVGYVKSHIQVYNQAPEVFTFVWVALILGGVLGIALRTSPEPALQNPLLGALVAVQFGTVLLVGDWLLFFSTCLGLFAVQLKLLSRTMMRVAIVGGTALCYVVATVAQVMAIGVQTFDGIAQSLLVFLCCILAYVFFLALSGRTMIRIAIVGATVLCFILATVAQIMDLGVDGIFESLLVFLCCVLAYVFFLALSGLSVVRRSCLPLALFGSRKFEGLTVALALGWLFLVPKAPVAFLSSGVAGFAAKLLLGIASYVYCLWVLARSSSTAPGPLFAMLLAFALPMGIHPSEFLGMLIAMVIIGFIGNASGGLSWPRKRWSAFLWLACSFVAGYVALFPHFRPHDWVSMQQRWQFLIVGVCALAFGLGMRPALSCAERLPKGLPVGTEL